MLTTADQCGQNTAKGAMPWLHEILIKNPNPVNLASLTLIINLACSLVTFMNTNAGYSRIKGHVYYLCTWT